MASRSINIHSPLARPPRRSTAAGYTRSICYLWHAEAERPSTCGKVTLCCAAQEPTTATVVTDDKEVTTAKKAVETAKATAAPAEKEAPARPKKAAAKPLPQMMEEDVIPSLKATLEAQEDISQIELSFDNNRVIFQKKRTEGRLGTGTWHEGLWYLDREGLDSALVSMEEKAGIGGLQQRTEETLILYHRRMEHSSFDTLRKLDPEIYAKTDKNK
ncbi:uncharacterized protein M6B38_274735 [Iris pallida]|uniref:Uncharacterized protein n=1 Tax=Iris pallida TaxID=29817 RepID=A0AAX6I771_IRIPA|nr:uncharacterized protein M6B38_274735 [Iris pallida]